MEFSNQLENDTFKLKSTDIYTQQINELNINVNILLDEFKKHYVISKMHPTNDEAQERFEEVVSKIEQLQSKLFTITNSVQVDISELNKNLFELNKLIKNEREKNRNLKIKLGIIQHENNASTEMINNYKEIYNIKYLRNWSLFLSTIIGVITIGTIYKNK